MTRLLLLLSTAAVIGVAVWAYNIGYDTRDAFKRLAEKRSELAAEREAIQVLRVEWAYLNNPARLQELVAHYQDELQLQRIAPESYSFAASIPFPPREELEDAPTTGVADLVVIGEDEPLSPRASAGDQPPIPVSRIGATQWSAE